MMQDMCILVVSCDKYADCWTPFSDCMRKFWPDCPYPVYLCTESGEPENGAVYSKVFHEQTQIWTARVRKACEKIKESHILVVLEDQWPSLPVSTATVQNILGLMHRRKTSASFTSIKKFTACRYGSRTATFICSLPKLPIACRSSLPFGTEIFC